MSRRNNRRSGMSSSNNNNQELDLKLNLSVSARPAAAAPRVTEVVRMSTSSSEDQSSPPRSCVSSEESLKYSSSPETTSMVLVGCPRCLMYVMLSEADPKCPKCKSTVLLDFLRNNNHNHNLSH
ncbi:hypothetical protein BVRB_7g170850 [Beta vulgaris subsp. vulgaris]|nr:hypothetical protein BVRB_7g170850 [Beta vulgaris subsp. vulgaris]